METGIVRGATLKRVKDREFNIYLGISLGNKWFTKEHVRGHIEWALKCTKEKVGILIADTLHAINYEFRNNIPSSRALVKSLEKGEEMCGMLKEIISTFSKREQDKIEIIRWGSILKDKIYSETLPIVKKEFGSNLDFRKSILNLIRSHVRRENRLFSERQIEGLGLYIVEELPQFLNGFTFKDIYYGALIYPSYSKLVEFMFEIQEKKIFPKLAEKIVKKHNVFVELK